MEFAKFIILLWQGQEQAVAFPAHIKHAQVFEYIRRQSQGVKAVSAGFFADEEGAFWHGGSSDSLNMASRPQDGLLIQRMIQSRDRRNWDLRVLVWEACEAARRSGPKLRAPAMSMSF